MAADAARDALEVRFHQDPAVLRVRVSGPNTLVNTRDYWAAVLEEVRRRPRPVLLVDELHGPALSPDQWGELVEALRGSALQGVRIAHVKARGVDALEFCELHAKDAGFVARVFTSEEEASRWLRYGESEPLPPRDAARLGYFSTKARSNT